MRYKVIVFALVTLVLASVHLAEAQQPRKVYHIGYLSPRLGIDSHAEAFRRGLSGLGFVEGQNTTIEWRFAKGTSRLFPELAAEVVRLKMDCILAVGVGEISSAKEATSIIPIVMGTIDADPVEQGFIASLARPGGNITGFTGTAYDIAGKRLELLKETVPKASRAAMLVAGSGAVVRAHLSEAELAARSLSMQLELLHVQEPEAPCDEDSKGEYQCPLGDLVGLNLLSEVSVKLTCRSTADVTASRQFIGVRRGLLRPERVILISPKVRDLTESAKLKGCEIEVVHLI